LAIPHTYHSLFNLAVDISQVCNPHFAGSLSPPYDYVKGGYFHVMLTPMISLILPTDRSRGIIEESTNELSMVLSNTAY
jgi:hypothetical protein